MKEHLPVLRRSESRLGNLTYHDIVGLNTYDFMAYLESG